MRALMLPCWRRRYSTPAAWRCGLIALGLIVTASPTAARAQRSGTGTKLPIDMVNSVIAYRLQFLGDSTPFDACALSRAVASDSFPAGIEPPLRSLLNRTDPQPCSPVPQPYDPLAAYRIRTVRLDSVSIGPTKMTLQFLVRKGEYRYFETYTLVPTPSGSDWGLLEVRIWGAIRYMLGDGGAGNVPKPRSQ